MYTLKKSSGLVTALLMTAAIGTAYANDGELTQTRTQDHVRTQASLQTADSGLGQSQSREQQMVINRNQDQNQKQHQNQYRYMNNFRTGKSKNGEVLMNQNTKRYTWQGDSTAGSMNTQSPMQRSMQGSALSGSMNRQNMSNRSMGGGSRR